MFKEILNVNRRILRDASRNDTTWLRKLELKVKKVFNQQISRIWELLMEVTCELSEKGSRKTNEQEDEKKSAFDQKIDLQSQNIGISW